MSFAPKFPPFIGTWSLQRRFADILEEFFCNKSGKHLGNWRRIVSFVSWSTKKTVVGPLVSFSWDVLFQETASATVTDGPEPKVTETTEIKKVREGAEATTQVSNHIIVLLQ